MEFAALPDTTGLQPVVLQLRSYSRLSLHFRDTTRLLAGGTSTFVTTASPKT
jgi:hypothetical protein